MASIHKRLNTKLWQCSYYVTDPETGVRRQVRKSTGQTSRKDALSAAATLEREDNERVGDGGGHGRRIQAVLTRAGEEAVRGTLSAARARLYLEEIVKISTGEEMPSFTVNTWFDEWLRRKEQRTSKATVARYRTSLGAFRRWLGDSADKPLESVSVSSVVRFRDSLKEEGRTSRTCNHYVRDLAGSFRTAVVEGLVTANPASGVDALELDDSIDRQPFTTAEVQSLVENAGTEDWKGAILMGAFTGLRLGDIARLTWESVNLEPGSIRMMPSKTKRKKKIVEIPLHPELKDYLMSHPVSDDPNGPLFPTLVKKSISGRRGLSLSFVDIMTEAGVSRGETREVSAAGTEEKSKSKGKKKEKPQAGRTVHARGFHSLRHTFTSWLANEDVPEDLRMLMVGHSDPAVHRGYTHHQVETLARAIEKLPGLTQSGDARSKA